MSSTPPLFSDLTVDIKVLVTGGRGREIGWREARLLMKEIETSDHLRVVVDQYRVLNQYRQWLPSSAYGQYWLSHILGTKKFKRVTTQALPKRTRIVFQERHFSKEDEKYVKTARESDSRLLVTTDPNYNGVIIHEISESMGISACAPITAHDYLCPGPIENCLQAHVPLPP